MTCVTWPVVSLALQSLFGFFALHALAWLVSERRAAVAWRPVIAGMVLTVALAVLFLKLPLFSEVFLWLNRAVGALDRATQAGTSFVFGYLGGAPLPFEEKPQVSSFILAFRALPLVLVISALSALFYYWRILPWLVRGFSWLLVRTMRVGGAVGLSAAANVFVGMVEAPLVVRPYVAAMSRSELFVTMSCGMATIAGTVMVLYATFLAKTVPDALAHILIASIIATPAAIAVALLMVPPAPGETTGRHRREARAVGRDRQHGRDHPRHDGRRTAPDQHRGHAARLRRAGEPRQRGARPPARRRRVRGNDAADARVRDGAPRLARGDPVVGGPRGGAAPGNEDRPERADRVPRPRRAAGRRACARAAGSS